MSTKLNRALAMTVGLTVIIASSSLLHADSGTCGGASVALPFNDVGNSIFFCQIAEAYFSGLTNGTSPTTYSPSSTVTREQMAAFITRTMDQSLRRGSRRAALGQWWTTMPHYDAGLATTPVSDLNHFPSNIASDGKHLWVTEFGDIHGNDAVLKFQASDGRFLGSWSGLTEAEGITIAMGKVFIQQATDGVNLSPSLLYMIDPAQPPGAATQVTTTSPLGVSYSGGGNMAFDGSKLWMANPRIFDGGQGSVSIITPGDALPWSSTTISKGFLQPWGLVFDGSNMWVTDFANQTIDKMDSNGGFQQIVTVGNHPLTPAFDGSNIWVPNSADNSISIVRASTGIVIATLTGNGLNSPQAASFDGQRVLVANVPVNSGSVSLWKAADLTPLGSFSMPSNYGPTAIACDGINFWFPLAGGFKNNLLARF